MLTIGKGGACKTVSFKEVRRLLEANENKKEIPPLLVPINWSTKSNTLKDAFVVAGAAIVARIKNKVMNDRI